MFRFDLVSLAWPSRVGEEEGGVRETFPPNRMARGEVGLGGGNTHQVSWCFGPDAFLAGAGVRGRVLGETSATRDVRLEEGGGENVECRRPVVERTGHALFSWMGANRVDERGVAIDAGGSEVGVRRCVATDEVESSPPPCGERTAEEGEVGKVSGWGIGAQRAGFSSEGCIERGVSERGIVSSLSLCESRIKDQRSEQAQQKAAGGERGREAERERPKKEGSQGGEGADVTPHLYWRGGSWPGYCDTALPGIGSGIALAPRYAHSGRDWRE